MTQPTLTDQARARRLQSLLEATWTATTPAQAAEARVALDAFYAEERAMLQAEDRRVGWGTVRPRVAALALAAALLFAVGTYAALHHQPGRPAEHGWLATQTGAWQASLGLQGPDIAQQALRPGEAVVLPGVEGPLQVDMTVQSFGEPPATLYAAAFFLHSGRATLVYRGTVAAGARFDAAPLQVPLAREPGELVFLVFGEPLPEQVLAQPDPTSVLALVAGDQPKWTARVPVEVP